MPTTFEHSDVVTVRAPDGRWFDVRLVIADGHRPRALGWLGRSGAAIVELVLYSTYRLAYRAVYRMRRSTATAVEVVPWLTGHEPPGERDPYEHREVLPDRDAARSRATEILTEVEQGRIPVTMPPR